jgi:hypothetical protein
MSKSVVTLYAAPWKKGWSVFRMSYPNSEPASSNVAAPSEPPDERPAFSLRGYLYPLTRGGLIGVHL